MSAEILFLCHRLPYPPNKGDKIRSHAILSYLAERHRVHLACFIDDPEDFQYTETVRRLAGGECLFVPLKPSRKWLYGFKALVSGEPITTAYFGNHKMAEWVKATIKARGITRALVFSSAMAPYLLDRSNVDPAHSVFDMVDVDSDKWRQYAVGATWPQRKIFQREAKRLLQLERNAAQAFGATILVSPYEAASFCALAPESTSRVHVLCNGVDLKHFAPGVFKNPFPANETSIVMTGRMDYHPNADGAQWFAREVMPHVRGVLPKARFHIIGSTPPHSLRELKSAAIEVHGHVGDVRPYLQHAAAVVAPLRMARGVQNKVLEALAMARPVVATWEATRALEVKSGSELWIENDPMRFAQAVGEAVQGESRESIAKNGRQYVERCHDWQKTLAPLEALLMGLGTLSQHPDRIPGEVVSTSSAAQSGHYTNSQFVSTAGAKR